MPTSYELDHIKSEEQAAFQRKQSLWTKLSEARDHASAAHDAMQSAWEERRDARERMNQEFEALQSSSQHYRAVWDEYKRLRDDNSSRIDSLRHEADYEHNEMRRCFEEASNEYQFGDKAAASTYSQEGHDHKERRDELNTEISQLCHEVKEAKQNAELDAPKPDSSAFRHAKERFERAKEHHESTQTEFKHLKSERDRLKDEFESAQTEYKRLKEEFNRKLEEVKAQNQRERDNTLDKAGVRYSERKDAIIVKKPDGTTQVYHGGIGSGDGTGHGHTALDQFGNKTYDRDAFSEHGSQNYTDRKTGGWSPIERGTIDGHKVTFRQGWGDKEGQTLISDGYVSGNQFHAHHSHYGPNDKSRFPNQPDRIEDSDKHKSDDAYTGPGH